MKVLRIGSSRCHVLDMTFAESRKSIQLLLYICPCLVLDLKKAVAHSAPYVRSDFTNVWLGETDTTVSSNTSNQRVLHTEAAHH